MLIVTGKFGASPQNSIPAPQAREDNGRQSPRCPRIPNDHRSPPNRHTDI